MVDAAQGTIPVRPTTVWLYKKYNICERGCQDRGRQKEIPDTYGKHAAPLARSSSVFGEFKKAESGSVQGATVNRRLVEPTNSASMDILYTSLGIVKKRLHLKKTRNENRKGEWLFLALLPIPQVPCQKCYIPQRRGLSRRTFRSFCGGEYRRCSCRPQFISLPSWEPFSSKPDTVEERPWRRGARGLPSRAGERRRCRRHPSKAQAPKRSSRTPLRE